MGDERVVRLLTMDEAAEILRCSKRFVQDECKAGRLRSRVVAGRYLVTMADIDDYLEAATCPAPTVARTSTGMRGARSGKSAGSSKDSAAAVARARETAARLRAS